MQQAKQAYTMKAYLTAWAVHLFTATGAFLGVLSLYQMYLHEYIMAFWIMGITIFIDAVDGTFARKAHVKSILPNIDGALLDNMVDFLNYVITPSFFLLVNQDMLPKHLSMLIIAIVCTASSYQFCQSDAKTPDHFFKGFPCYWNFAVFYMFIFNATPMSNALILLILSVLIFVPIKYVYPSRIDYLTNSKSLKRVMHLCSALFGLSSVLILWTYPLIESMWLFLSVAYILLYLSLSVYRTFYPLNEQLK